MDTATLLSFLGRRIRALREGRGWSQEDLARRSARHFTYIGRIERGEQNVTIEVLFEIAAALDTTPDELLAPEPKPLLVEWGVTAGDLVDAVSHGFRAQVDVKGKLAELMLFRDLSHHEAAGEIQKVSWLDQDGKPDFVVTIGKKEMIVECKNVRSATDEKSKAKPIRVELQKTRNSKDGAPTRGYVIGQFDVLSVCLFNRTRRWQFLHIAARNLKTKQDDAERLEIMQAVPAAGEGMWHSNILEAIADASR